MAMNNLIKQLVDYDPHYAMTDDHRWYEKGLDAERKLKAELKNYQLHDVLSYLEALKREAITLYNHLN